jgi:hypothetical protein
MATPDASDAPTPGSSRVWARIAPFLLCEVCLVHPEVTSNTVCQRPHGEIDDAEQGSEARCQAER